MTDESKPASSRVLWWLLAVPLLAIPVAFAKQKPKVPARRPNPGTPEPNRDSIKSFVKAIVFDQKIIWTSPFGMTSQNAKWWVLFASATVALLATDRRSAQQLLNAKNQLSVSRRVSQLGAEYSLVPIVGCLYLGGALSGDSKLRETGLLGAEALVDALIVSQVLKAATGRQRPLEGNGSGHFLSGGDGFLSGHTIESFSLASVIAHRYHGKRAVALLAYGLATAIGASRFTGRKHFASDVFAGWFIGRLVSQGHLADARSRTKMLSMPEVLPRLGPANHSYGSLLIWPPRWSEKRGDQLCRSHSI
jgi:membrane-associated phospholipid phosphatase